MRARVRRDASGPSLSRVVNKASTVKHETAERARAASVSSEREAGTEARIEKAGLEPAAPSTSTPWPVLAAATLPRDGLPVHSPLAEGVDIDDIEGAAYFVFDAPDEQDADVVEVLNTASLDTRDYLVTWTDGPEVRELFKAAGLTVFTIDGADDRIFGASYPVEDRAWLHKDAEEERKRELHAKWSKLINMSASEIKRFLDSEDGKDAGMSAGAARAAGIGRGRDSARAIIRMLGNGRGVEQALENWSAGDWRWAGRQVSFISRMKGNSGPLYDDKKRMTRKLKSLLVWGHDPRKSGASKADEDPKTPADPDERRSGSSRNKPGSSSSASSGAGIKVTEAIETALKRKVEEHNEKHGDTASKRVTLGMLKAVWRRGAGAFSSSHRPSQNRQSWAMARVNAFLKLVRSGRPNNPKYITDNDLLPKGHARSTRKGDLSLGPGDPGYLQPEQDERMRRVRSFAHGVNKMIEGAKIYKAEGDERYVLGVVLEPDEIDSQSDTISAEDIRNAAHKFMQEYGNIGLQHQTFVNGKIKILESYVAPVEFEIGEQAVKAGTWLLALRVIDDSIWGAIKDGRLTGLSIGGTGVRKPTTS